MRRKKKRGKGRRWERKTKKMKQTCKHIKSRWAQIFLYRLLKESKDEVESLWCHLLDVAWLSSSASWFLLCNRVAKRLRDQGCLLKVGVSGCCSDLDRFWLEVEYCCSTSWSDIPQSLGDMKQVHSRCHNWLLLLSSSISHPAYPTQYFAATVFQCP